MLNNTRTVQLLSDHNGVFTVREPFTCSGETNIRIHGEHGDKDGSLSVNGLVSYKSSDSTFKVRLKDGNNTLAYIVGSERYKIEPLIFENNTVYIDSIIGTEAQYIKIATDADSLKISLDAAKKTISEIKKQISGFSLFG